MVLHSVRLQTKWLRKWLEWGIMDQQASDSVVDTDIIQAFVACGPGRQPYAQPGRVTDFLGISTRTAYIDSIAHLAGTVETPPIPANFHASQLEWAGTLRSALQTERTFVAIELGAGWCPWLLAGAVAAERCGAEELKLCGVEACSGHVEYARQHFLDNPLESAHVELLHGIAGVRDGYEKFPDVDNPAGNWGAAAFIAGSVGHQETQARYSGVRRLARLVRAGSLRAWQCLPGQSPGKRLRSYALSPLIEQHDWVDLLHVDIQGHEFDVLNAAIEQLCQRVKRIVIGTHSESLATQLRKLLESRDWLLEAEEACQVSRSRGKESLLIDGCQVWRNSRWLPAVTKSDLSKVDSTGYDPSAVVKANRRVA